jgi:hypothetical protein
MTHFLLLLVLALSASPPQGAKRTFAGSAACAECHPPQARKQLASNMAKAASTVTNHPLLDRFRTQTARLGQLQIRFRLANGELHYEVADGLQTNEIPAHWAFGSGVQGVTFVTQLDGGEYLESRVSYYSDTGSLDFTPGRVEMASLGPDEVTGHRFVRNEALRCFSCHTTGTRMDPVQGNLIVGELGVRCEACHGPGLAHVSAAKQNEADRARREIRSPGRQSARAIMDLCAGCHRQPPKDAILFDWSKPVNTRFQPVGLSQSRCLKGGDGSLSCTTCHDPHEDARRNDPEFYAQKCKTCHTAARKPPAPACGAEGASKCVQCHMPRVTALPHLDFTNHWIGVYVSAQKLVPLHRSR